MELFNGLKLKRAGKAVFLSLVLGLASCVGNQGSWEGQYCVGEPCRETSRSINHSGYISEKITTCPETFTVHVTSIIVGKVTVPIYRTDYLRSQGSCKITLPTPTPTLQASPSN